MINAAQTLSVCLIAAMPAWCGLGTLIAASPSSAHGREDIQVLTRGPVHEAFAETVTFDPRPGIVAPQAPPDPIEELPPQHKPEGTNVAWIPGYWAWDDDSDDFLWVSGIWRNLPPGRQWVPGYWSRSAQGARWTSGYWAKAQTSEIEYLPEPPESVEAGSNIEAPSADHTWLPGCWIWQQNRYVWRPGFWTRSYENWIWTPAHYQWTPRGYVFVDGYWDHAVPRRGLLFAPVRFDQRVYSQRGFSYTPATRIDLGAFLNHLFLRPNYGHYYYGDYYGANYTSEGFYPSYSFHSSRRGYDPIYSHQRWQHRQDSGWEGRVQEYFLYRRNHEEARPPRTFAAQQERLRKGPAEQDQGRVVAQPLDQVNKGRESPLQLQQLNNDERQRFGRHAQEVRTLREQRQKLETPSLKPDTERPGQQQQPTHIPLPQSPIVGQEADELGEELAPPERHEFPEPDPEVVPSPRPSDVQSEPPKPETTPEPPQDEPKAEPAEAKPEEKPEEKPEAKPEEQPEEKPEDKPDEE